MAAEGIRIEGNAREDVVPRLRKKAGYFHAAGMGCMVLAVFYGNRADFPADRWGEADYMRLGLLVSVEEGVYGLPARYPSGVYSFVGENFRPLTGNLRRLVRNEFGIRHLVTPLRGDMKYAQQTL